MQILTNYDVVMFYGTIEKGIYDADPSRELYKITNGDNIGYAVTEGFELYNVDSLPDDYKDGYYCYTIEKGFYVNPDWKEPEPSPEEKIAALESEITNNQMALAELYEMLA